MAESDRSIPRDVVSELSLPARSAELRAQRRQVLSGVLQLTHMLNDAISAGLGAELSSNNDASVLLMLALNGPQRPRELTALTGLTRGGTTNMIDRLEGGGLVSRHAAADDRRGMIVSITPEGTKVVEQVATRANRVLTFATPLIDGWKEHFKACGCELGPRRTPHGLVQALEHLLELSAAGTTIGPVYRAVFGPDDPSPYLTMHVLLLATEPGGTRPTRISDATHLSSASTSDLLDRMERDDLVVRIAGVPPDRRVTVVTATERGRAALDQTIDGTDATIRATANALFPPPQRKRTRRHTWPGSSPA